MYFTLHTTMTDKCDGSPENICTIFAGTKAVIEKYKEAVVNLFHQT